MKHVVSALLAVGVLLGTLAVPLAASAQESETFFNEYNETVFNQPQSRNRGSVSIKVGQTKNLSGNLLYKNIENEDSIDYEELAWYLTGTITWTSSNDTIATVDEAGQVTGRRIGGTKITATATDNLGRRHTQIFSVQVRSATADTPETSFNVKEGSWLDLSQLVKTPGDVAWSSSNDTIASVDGKGLVSAVSIGSGTITATVTDGNGNVAQEKFKVRVTTMILEHRTDESSIEVTTGGQINLLTLLYPTYQGLRGAYDGITCTTGDDTVIQVKDGMLTAKATGTGKVTVKEKKANGEYRTHILTVYVTD